ncbi:MAG: DUF4258 domain-containing protein [Bacteroidota bacterium]|nr:DUF4258 domain-containing protein [Bacteroidota bacterium]
MKQLFYFIFLSAFIACNHPSQGNKAILASTASATEAAADGLNRHPHFIHYSKHAKCRMDCRHIDESEIKSILENGQINYRKSELNGDACHQKYAVEGYAKDTHLRIIFAPCEDKVTVVTCIDLDHEWECHCPGDNH